MSFDKLNISFSRTLPDNFCTI